MNNQNNFNFHQRIPNPTASPAWNTRNNNQWPPAPPQPPAGAAGGAAPWPADYSASDMGTERDRQINLPGLQRYDQFGFPQQQHPTTTNSDAGIGGSGSSSIHSR